MKKLALIFAPAALLTIVLTAPAFADDDAGKDAAPAKDAPIPKEEKAVTQHSVTVGGKSISYSATAGTLLIKNEKDEPVASMFYVAYTTGDTHRPVTFIFNGGPGSSSMWLHMGSFAPLRVVTPDAQPTPPAPYDLAPNPSSLLDKSDLVFVDAIGTGFSKPVGKGTGKDFYGVDQDISAFGRFIQRYISVNDRWNSPKFLLGESYGTTRAAGLSYWLEGKGIALNGVVLVSSWLDPYVDFFGPNYAIDEPYELYLPTMAATAWYHHKIANPPADINAFVQQAREFALGEYATALTKGDNLSPADTQAIAQKLSAFIGLPVDYILKAKLRITPDRFQKELLRDEGRVTGRLDTRYLGIDHDSAGESPESDAASDAFGPAFVASFNNYVRTQLNFGQDMSYKPTNYEVGSDWDWSHRVDGQKSPVFDVAEDLRQAMTEDPHMLVFSANGYYDFATPFLETEYTLDHMGLDPSLRKNLRYGYYQSGHMIYMHEDALKALKADLAKFYDDATRH
ncbi:MAG: S10 family peptidase [Gammaproteobacteria bacterium]